MSLLIKALESAERGKQAELKRGAAEATSFDDLGLEPLSTPDKADAAETVILNSAAEAPASKTDSFNAAAAVSVAKVKQQSEVKQSEVKQPEVKQPEVKKDHKQQVAANVFVANQAAKNSTSLTALLMLGVAGALVIWLCLQGYQYLSKVNTPETIVVKPVPQVAVTTELASAAWQPVQTVEAQTAYTENPAADAVGSAPKTDVNIQNSTAAQTALVPENNTAVSSSVFSNRATASKVAPSRVADLGDAVNANASTSTSNTSEFNKRSPLKLVSRTQAAGVDPTLLSAYEAYSRGDDAMAQKQYRQVLQVDTRNVDALLGMAAIALRQSRYADANGWYQKVLEIEPRNSTALSAVANLQISGESADAATADYASTESHIKSMLAQQPEAANLHAALGNLYAAQSQWSLAQAAYFNASRYAPNSADYAFNMAVSLDQLGKSGLALAQYQRALGLLASSGAGSLDKAQLEARIQALQQ